MPPLLTLDKLTIGNAALIDSANNVVETEGDGSDEWLVISAAYDRLWPVMMSRRNWNFDTRILALNRLGDSDYPPFTDEFAKPPDSLFIQKVWRPDIAGFMPQYQGEGISSDEDIRLPALDYRIVGDVIHTSAPNGATAKYAVANPDPSHWSVLFGEALRLGIKAACYRSLNEDDGQADKWEKLSEMMLNEAATRSNAEEPRRVGFRSGLAESRRYGRRRAWR